MSINETIYLGIDCGATTSKVGGIHSDGSILSNKLRQSPTQSDNGPQAMLDGWLNGATSFLQEESLHWDQIVGIGIAMPGPYLSYGVLGKLPNMSHQLEGWNYRQALADAVAEIAGREIPVHTANDGQLAGVSEAALIQAEQPGSVLMLAPGSGLGCSFVDASGALFSGDHQASAILCHMPAPYQLLGLPAFSDGCGRQWSCLEAYTAISGLPQYIDHLLPEFPGHELDTNALTPKEKALKLRGLAQDGDPLAVKIFEFQAVAMGYAVSIGCLAYDPTHIVIGGGLMDTEATTPAFREKYLNTIKETAAPFMEADASKLVYHEARLGDLSQAIGAALMIKQRCNQPH